mmetsp:Transcript_2403/g.3348  ORF Transcript_2403/g.3348 Transcript_2403/m.3348 type:complete len:81 (-) Transcript_2403:705-947(-)
MKLLIVENADKPREIQIDRLMPPPSCWDTVYTDVITVCGKDSTIDSSMEKYVLSPADLVTLLVTSNQRTLKGNQSTDKHP